MVEDITPKFDVGDRVEHQKDGWQGTIEKIVTRSLFGIRRDNGAYYVAQGTNLRRIV